MRFTEHFPNLESNANESFIYFVHKLAWCTMELLHTGSSES